MEDLTWGKLLGWTAVLVSLGVLAGYLLGFVLF